MKKPRKKPVKHEELLQKAVVNLLRMYEAQRKLTFTANYQNVPRSDTFAARSGAKNKAMGVRKGFPDMTIFRFESKPIFLELKSKKGQLQDNQEDWRDTLQAMGFSWYLVRSIDDVKEVLTKEGVI